MDSGTFVVKEREDSGVATTTSVATTTDVATTTGVATTILCALQDTSAAESESTQWLAQDIVKANGRVYKTSRQFIWRFVLEVCLHESKETPQLNL